MVSKEEIIECIDGRVPKESELYDFKREYFSDNTKIKITPELMKRVFKPLSNVKRDDHYVTELFGENH